jgi:hypothetical protein
LCAVIPLAPVGPSQPKPNWLTIVAALLASLVASAAASVNRTSGLRAHGPIRCTFAMPVATSSDPRHTIGPCASAVMSQLLTRGA